MSVGRPSALRWNQSGGFARGDGDGDGDGEQTGRVARAEPLRAEPLRASASVPALRGKGAAASPRSARGWSDLRTGGLEQARLRLLGTPHTLDDFETSAWRVGCEHTLTVLVEICNAKRPHFSLRGDNATYLEHFCRLREALLSEMLPSGLGRLEVCAAPKLFDAPPRQQLGRSQSGAVTERQRAVDGEGPPRATGQVGQIGAFEVSYELWQLRTTSDGMAKARRVGGPTPLYSKLESGRWPDTEAALQPDDHKPATLLILHTSL